MEINRVRRHINPNLKVDGILITMVDNRTRLGRGLINVIRRDYGQSPSVFHTVIPLSVKAKEATVSGVSVFKHDEKGKITEAYQSLTQEVLSDTHQNTVMMKGIYLQMNIFQEM